MLTTSSSCPRLSRASTSFFLRCKRKTWMAGTSPAMTTDVSISSSRTCECIPILALPRSPMIVASCPVKGASRGHSEMGQSESWPEGQPDGDAAPAAVVCTHRLGRPWVTVRAHYGALPSMAGRGWSERVKAFGIMAQASPRPGSTVPGTKKSPRRNAERRCRVPLFPGNPGNKPRPLPRCAARRSVTPHLGVRPKQTSGSWSHENAEAWLFEFVDRICRSRGERFSKRDDLRAFASPKGLRPRRRVKPGNDGRLEL
jgi:hypothetical protein